MAVSIASPGPSHEISGSSVECSFRNTIRGNKTEDFQDIYAYILDIAAAANVSV